VVWHPDITFHSDGQHPTNLITMNKAGNNTHRTRVRWFLLNMSSAGPNRSMLPFTQASPISTASQPPASVFCPECREQVGYRQQELKRHMLSVHLPPWIYCPHPSCPWRGRRKEDLKRHMEKEKCGPKPEPEQYQIYDTKLILGWILEGDIPLKVAAGYALDFVRERAIELGKVEAWRDL
jgi:hypothetical protein